MLRIVVATVLLSSPVCAGAQTFSRTQATIGGYSHQTLETSYANLGSSTRSAHGGSQSDEECLTRKKTGKLECHTYAEWVEIARAIDASRK